MHFPGLFKATGAGGRVMSTWQDIAVSNSFIVQAPPNVLAQITAGTTIALPNTNVREPCQNHAHLH